MKVAKVHERLANLRTNFSHQLTHTLMRYPALCLENLSIQGLAKTKLAESMLDAAFGQVIEQWKYKIVVERNPCLASRPFLSLNPTVLALWIPK